MPKDLLVVHVPCRVPDGGFVTIFNSSGLNA
jgi:hypothetical protein